MKNDILIAVFTTFLTTLVFFLISRYIWDRYLSQNSRITKDDCTNRQKICRDGIIAELKIHTSKLDEGDICFDDTRHIQRAVLVTLLAICNHLNVPCDALTKVMVDADIMR